MLVVSDAVDILLPGQEAILIPLPLPTATLMAGHKACV